MPNSEALYMIRTNGPHMPNGSHIPFTLLAELMISAYSLTNSSGKGKSKPHCDIISYLLE